MAETRESAYKAFDRCVRRFEAKYPKAMECLVKDKESLLAFYDFPAAHWQHIRTTNPIESVFATVRLSSTLSYFRLPPEASSQGVLSSSVSFMNDAGNTIWRWLRSW